MHALERAVDAIAAETGFSGVVHVDVGDGIELAKAYGLANRSYKIANTVDTRHEGPDRSRDSESDRRRFTRSHDDSALGAR